MAMEIKKPFVVGAGIMGAGIGQLCAQHGYEVTITDVSDDVIQKARERVAKGLERQVEKGRMTEADGKAIISRMTWSLDLNLARESDFVIEAVSENLDLKKELFSKLDALCSPQTILASNTTALSVSEIASATQRPGRIVGMHFFNPAVIMKLVEIIRGQGTSAETIETAKKFAEKLGKVPVVTAKEAPGGIVSRVLAGLLNEAAIVYADGIASAQDIDEALKLGAGLPMGPLALIDMIGLDIHLAKMETLYKELQDSRYKPPEIIKRMVSSGKLGKKSGEGFFKY
jgi:3-hydroxybutyryl-CoA dehydrogenase